MKLKFSIPILLLFIFSSCTHETTLQPDSEQTVYFDTQVLPIFTNSCALSGCHNSATRESGYDLSTYASITSKGITPGDALNSSVYKTIIGSGELMPPDNPLPISQRNLIRVWIDQGAENTVDPSTIVVSDSTDSGDSTDTGVAFCFERDVQPILVSNCATSGCHDATTHEEGYNFTTYESTIHKGVVSSNASQSKIYKVITTSPNEDDFMPPSPRAALSSDEVAAIARWINEGAKNETCSVQCDSNAIDYSANIAPIIQKYCRGCHQSGASNGNVILETQSQLESIALDGRLLNTLNAANGFTKMPPSGSVSSCEKQQLTNWTNSLNQ